MTTDSGIRPTVEPGWIEALLAELRNRLFTAEDQPLAAAESPTIYTIGQPETELPLNELQHLATEAGFTAELARLVGERWTGTKRELCERALLLENTFYKIQSGKRTPCRETVICLALALRLSPDETRNLLGYLGYGLSEALKRDYLLIRSLELAKPPLETNLLLERCHLRLLGPEK